MNVHDAKTHFSQLLKRVEAGEEIVITRAGRPVARLVPIEAPRRKRELGVDAGKVTIAEDFDAPLPDELLRAFEA